MNNDWFSILSLSALETEPKTTVDFTVQYHQLITLDKKDEANKIREEWRKNNIYKDYKNNDNDLFLALIGHPAINFLYLPNYSFSLQFKFTLEKPYISRDEQEFYIIDNPIRKDKIFGLPYVAPSSWKGSLRSALWHLGYKEEDVNIKYLLGNERGTTEHKKLHRGRLHFFPTFFTKKSLEVINPHDRESRVGKNPILIECVPEGSSGLFTLLYVPFDVIGKEKNTIMEEMQTHIQLTIEGATAMFRDYGFGAKTSSGNGIAKSELTHGKLILNTEAIETSQKEEIEIQETEEAFKKYLNEDGGVKEEFKGSGEEKLLSNTQYGKIKDQLGGGSLTEFKKFRRWYVRFGEQWQKYIQSRNAPTPRWPAWSFESFDELLEKAAEIEKVLKSKEASQ